MAPGDRHLELGPNRSLRILDTAPVSGQRPAATVLFRAMARQCGASGIGVLLTGMGEDGALGLLDMQAAGAQTIAEHESTAVVYGMPAAAVRLGAARSVLPLDRSRARSCASSIPRPPRERPRECFARGGPRAGPAPHILLVEDSETQALELRLLLEQNGFAVARAATAEAALDHLNRELPDLVVADYHLPGMNGDELTRQMRLSLRTRALPLLMLTGAREGERQGLESGADAYVAKSDDRDLLVLRIRALLRERGKSASAKSVTGKSATGRPWPARRRAPPGSAAGASSSSTGARPTAPSSPACSARRATP